MAKKTSRNAVKKIDSQINSISSSNKNSTIKGSASRSSYSKTNNVKSLNSNEKNTRDSVVIPVPKKAPVKKKSATSKNNVRGEVIVAPQKTRTSTKGKSTSRNVRGEVLVSPTKSSSSSKKISKKTSTSRVTKKKEDKIVDAVRLDHNVEEIINDIEREKEESLIEEFDIDISFENNKDDNKTTIPNVDRKSEVSIIKNKTRKDLSEKEYDELKLDKPIDLDNFDKLDSYKIINEFEEDIYKDREIDNKNTNNVHKSSVNIFKKKRDVISDTPKSTSYNELENDLRSLYDKVNDVVSDFGYEEKYTPSKRTIDKNISKKNVKVKNDIPKKPLPRKPIENKQREKTTFIENDVKPEKKILLDYINQKVLNFFLILLLLIFTGMTIAFVWFLIYVSTF